MKQHTPKIFLLCGIMAIAGVISLVLPEGQSAFAASGYSQSYKIPNEARIAAQGMINTATPVPEPSTIALLGLGALAFLGVRRRAQ